MKLVHLLVLPLILLPTDLHGQANLNPPQEFELLENFEQEFESAEFGTQLVDQVEEPKITGINQYGAVEYSVLENPEVKLEPSSYDTIIETTGMTSSGYQAAGELNQLLTGIVLKHLPHEYVQDKKWGQQSKRWSGVKFRRDEDDGKLETKRKYKMVNHGTWQKYSAELMDPVKRFDVQLENISRNRNGDTRIDVEFTAPLKLDARQSKWVKGVQLYSLSAEGNATVRLLVSFDLGMDLDFSQFPPDVLLSPVVTKAKIDVQDFKLDRVSKAGGEVAQQITRLAKKELQSKIVEKEKKLVKKMNQEIDENRDQLRISVANAFQLEWFDRVKDHIPAEIRNTIAGNDRGELGTESTESRRPRKNRNGAQRR